MNNVKTKCPICSGELEKDGLCLVCLLNEGIDAAAESASPPGRLRDLPVEFAGHRLTREIASGGMGIVFEAENLKLRRVVALKVIRNAHFATREEAARFRAEMQVVARLDHPNIVPVYESGEADGLPFFTMRLAEGGSLAERLKKAGPLPEREAVVMMSRIARAVQHAHEHGVLHRDLKPANILLDQAGQPLLADFGLAKRLGAESLLTRGRAHVGTPHYMSPEQAAGGSQQMTTASDVWALGVMLCQMLTGKLPFDGGSAVEVMRRVSQEEPVLGSPTRQRFRDRSSTMEMKTPVMVPVHADLATLIRRSLEKVPAKRLASAGFLADELDRFLAGDNASALFDATGLLVSIQTEQPTIGSGDTIKSTDGRTIVLGGAGIDNIATGRGDDVILGDHGIATFVTSGLTPSSIGSIVFSNDGILTCITSTDPTIGANDIITGSDGFNVIVGGVGADQITGGANRDIVIGDNGRALFDNTGVLTLIESTDASIGGSSDDSIIVGNGPDIVIGGNGKDNIQAAGDISDDIVIGDNGKATFDSTAGQSILRDIISTDPDLGDDDTINAGDGYNIVIGGFGKDGITGGANTDVILGDNGHAVFNAAGVLTFITTTNPAIGDTDTITFGAGGNTVFGGAGSDTLTGLEGTDVIVGDNGNATFTDTGLLTFITTSDVTIGAADTISTGAGFNTVLGGVGKDVITGGVNTDVIIGDHGNATFDPSSGESIIRDIISTDPSDGDDDTIIVGDGFNAIIGGFGSDQVTGGAGDDVILGDNGHAIFNTTGILTFITTIEPTIGSRDVISVGDGNNTVLSGLGADEVNGGVSGDVVIGDHGNATFTDAGILTFITTTQPDVGNDDIIKVSGGFNVILAGFGADQVTGGDGRDVVLGDNGNATFTAAGVLTFITTTEPTIGNDDIIFTGAGDNIVIGGFGADQVTGGADRDIVLGDNGNATFTTAGILTFITTTEPTIGNDDVILTGDGDNIIIGGFGADQVTGGANRDVVLGDNGNATFTTSGVLTFITTTQPDIGNDDIITTGDGDNIVIGGFGADQITGGTGRDVVLGDNGNATFDTTGVLIFITTSDPAIGSDDTIITGDGFNVVFAGIGGDRVTGGTGRDVILGDNGNATFDSTAGGSILRDIISTETGIGGADIINGGSGNNIVIGGTVNDTITTLGGDDIILGDSGHAVFNAAEILTYITTITPDIGGDDTIDAGDGDNIVFGGFGKDRLTSGSGMDFVLGDNGNATFDDSAVLLYLTTTEHTIGDDDTIFSGGGDDIVFGATGADYIDGGAGDDSILGDFGAYSREKLIYELEPRGVFVLDQTEGGNDTIYGGDGDDRILSEGGDDFIDGQSGHDIIFAGHGDDTVHGGIGGDVLVGGPGWDFLDGDSGADSLYVDIYDVYTGGIPEDTVIGGSFFSTDTQLGFGLPVLGAAGIQDGGGLLEAVVSSVLGVVFGDESGSLPGFAVSSSIFTADFGLVLLTSTFNDLRWGGAGQTFILLFWNEINGSLLIGIGEFLEVLWSDIMALING